ncbi:hypothetical protein LZ31DRAFT_15578 [Colletotrichum somersetense]|nr:hypothetical protein LZ31DRAFT_15578 [Colletotrichum somersetense]
MGEGEPRDLLRVRLTLWSCLVWSPPPVSRGLACCILCRASSRGSSFAWLATAMPRQRRSGLGRSAGSAYMAEESRRADRYSNRISMNGLSVGMGRQFGAENSSIVPHEGFLTRAGKTWVSQESDGKEDLSTSGMTDNEWGPGEGEAGRVLLLRGRSKERYVGRFDRRVSKEKRRCKRHQVGAIAY